jgi:hypothetical protein
VRKRLLVLPVVAAMSLVSLAGPAAADTTVKIHVSCTGLYKYSADYSVSVSSLPAGFDPNKEYTVKSLNGKESCTISLATPSAPVAV